MIIHFSVLFFRCFFFITSTTNYSSALRRFNALVGITHLFFLLLFLSWFRKNSLIEMQRIRYVEAHLFLSFIFLAASFRANERAERPTERERERKTKSSIGDAHFRMSIGNLFLFLLPHQFTPHLERLHFFFRSSVDDGFWRIVNHLDKIGHHADRP